MDLRVDADVLGVALLMQKPSIRIISSTADIRERARVLLQEFATLPANDAQTPDALCVACDHHLLQADIEVARRLGEIANIPVMVLAWNGCEQLAVQALRSGAKEYLRGTADRAEIARAVISLCQEHREAQLAASESLVGQSASIRATRNYIERVARTSSNVLITGETGTGKELIAELIHRNSARAHKPLVCINCAAIPDTLLESELFGFERGAFTGAFRTQDGKFKLADGGTVFLDEIGDMSPYAQAKILRVIESHEVMRLGGTKAQRVDFRVIAATNRDLEALSQEELFRRDLFFRLNVARIHLPPLRERSGDLLELANHFRREFNASFGRQTMGFTARAEHLILNHQWPGNVRELKNMIEAAFINLDPQCEWVEMPELFCQAVERAGDAPIGEVARILSALSQTQWNKSKAANILNWSRMTLYRKIERHGLQPPDRDKLAKAQ